MSLRFRVLEAQHSAVVGGVWLLPSGVASNSLSTLIEYFLIFSHTPVTEMMNGDKLYFSYVFDVILVSIHSPLKFN